MGEIRPRISVEYAGGATMEVAGMRTVMGHSCLDIRTEARSNRFFSAFYKVWNRAETFLEPVSWMISLALGMFTSAIRIPENRSCAARLLTATIPTAPQPPRTVTFAILSSSQQP